LLVRFILATGCFKKYNMTICRVNELFGAIVTFGNGHAFLFFFRMKIGYTDCFSYVFHVPQFYNTAVANYCQRGNYCVIFVMQLFASTPMMDMILIYCNLCSLQKGCRYMDALLRSLVVVLSYITSHLNK
jgi:hypothetical protein